jgi:hypothetical protein
MSDSTSQIVIAMAIGVIGALILCHVMGNQSDQVSPEPISPPVISAAPVDSSKPPVQDKDAKKGQYNRVTKGTRAYTGMCDRAVHVMPPNQILKATGLGQQYNADDAKKLPKIHAPSPAYA